jgi:hypothetical protein
LSIKTVSLIIQCTQSDIVTIIEHLFIFVVISNARKKRPLGETGVLTGDRGAADCWR